MHFFGNDARQNCKEAGKVRKKSSNPEEAQSLMSRKEFKPYCLFNAQHPIPFPNPISPLKRMMDVGHCFLHRIFHGIASCQ